MFALLNKPGYEKESEAIRARLGGNIISVLHERNNNNSNNNQIIRFDWAMKRLLRNKANFSVLEGLLTSTFLNAFVIPIVYELMNRKKSDANKQ